MRPVRQTVLGLALVAAACNRGQNEKMSSSVLATVGGEALTIEAFVRELRQSRREEGLRPGSEEVFAAMRRAKLDEVIERMLLAQAARDANVVVPQERVESEVLKLRAEYPGSTFEEMLAQGEISTAELKARVLRNLTAEKLITEKVYARVAVTEAEVEAYYQTHAEEFALPEQVRAQHIVVHSYDEAKRVQAELRRGMSFEAAARRFGLGPEAKVGGDLGFFSRGVMPAVFDQACFGRPKGAMTDVVTSDYGFHIFKVVDQRPAGRRPLADVRTQIEAKVKRQKQAAAEREFKDQLRSKAHIVVNDEALARVR